MSANDIDLAVQDYTANVVLLLQQLDSRFVPYVGTGTYIGKAAQVVDQVGAITATKVISKYGPIGRTDTPNDQRWVYPSDYEVKPQIVDTFDNLRLKIGLEGPFTRSAAAALARAKDDEIIAAFFGTSKTGVDGGTSTTFGTTVTTSGGRNVSVNSGGTDSGLNVAKLREAKKRLMSQEVDFSLDPVACAVTAAQHDNLLADIQVVSRDFGWNDSPVLKEGKVSRFLGTDFLHSERLQNGTDDAAGTSRMVPFWAKSGMHLGMWNDVEHHIDPRPDLNSRPWQVYSYGTFGATRTEENRVVRIWCND